MWVATADLPQSAGHPCYERLNRVLHDAGFDAFVEAQCAKFYAATVGRPSLAPGRSFRVLRLGYFAGVDSERAIRMQRDFYHGLLAETGETPRLCRGGTQSLTVPGVK